MANQQQVISRTVGSLTNRTTIASEARRRIQANQQSGLITPQQAEQFYTEVRKVQFGEKEPSHLEQFGLRDRSDPVGLIQARQSEIDQIVRDLNQRNVQTNQQVQPLQTEALATGSKLRETLQDAGVAVADALIPGLWARNWNQLSTSDRVLNTALDAIFLVPLVGQVGRASLKGSRRAIQSVVSNALESPNIPASERRIIQQSVNRNTNRLSDALARGDSRVVKQVADSLERDFSAIGLPESASRFRTLSRESDNVSSLSRQTQERLKITSPETTGMTLAERRLSLSNFKIEPTVEKSIAQRIEKNVTKVTDPFAKLNPETAAARKANLNEILSDASQQIKKTQQKKGITAEEKPTARTRREVRESQLPKRVLPEEFEALRQRGKRTQVATIEGKLSEIEEALKRPAQTRINIDETRRLAQREFETRQRASKNLAEADRSRAIQDVQRQLRVADDKRRAEEAVRIRLQAEKIRRETIEKRIQQLRKRREQRLQEIERQRADTNVRKRSEVDSGTSVRKRTQRTRRQRSQTASLPRTIPSDDDATDSDAVADRPGRRTMPMPRRTPDDQPDDQPGERARPVPAPRRTPDDQPGPDDQPRRTPDGKPDPDDQPGPDDQPRRTPDGKPDPDDPPGRDDGTPKPDPNRTPRNKKRSDDGDKISPVVVRDISGQSRNLPVNEVATRHGAFWYVTDLVSGKIISVSDDPPAGIPDIGTPQESLTITKRGTKRPTQTSLDMGVVRANIGRRGRTITFESLQ